MVKLTLRDKEYEVKPGMNLLSALQKCNITPESVIATREGEMILDDEILKDGDVVKLVAVISGGSHHCEERSSRRSILQSEQGIVLGCCPRNDGRLA
ncbi:MAG TPA: MoaD/ThiS family protein [Anaerolineales bacterium]|nr:MoaD/ThiS family protein [Anaerolineales bacterium]